MIVMRKCRQCREQIPSRKDCKDPYARGGFCDIACYGLHKAKKDREARNKAKNAKHKEDLQRVKPMNEKLKALERIVNKYINLRDFGKPCISCDTPHAYHSERHASHYRSVGACSSARFYTLNIHTSCGNCNKYLSGNAVEYRIRLVKKIGEESVHRIEAMPKQFRYSDEWIEKASKAFRAKIMIIERRRKI